MQQWFSAMELPLTWEQFGQLPRNAAYKYEYFHGRAWLSPRPKLYRAVLDLADCAPPSDDGAIDNSLVTRPFQEGDWAELPALFAAAFRRVQPFASLADGDCLPAAEDCLGRTRAGGEGPLIGEACRIAARAEDNVLTGAILVTLPPDDDIAPASGLPHLTWIFVHPAQVRQGTGMALLHSTARALLSLGHSQLASTFLLGNDSSTLWHWRAGFRLM
jgi:hypothetical protein